jgi:hypothetical protein
MSVLRAKVSRWKKVNDEFVNENRALFPSFNLTRDSTLPYFTKYKKILAGVKKNIRVNEKKELISTAKEIGLKLTKASMTKPKLIKAIKEKKDEVELVSFNEKLNEEIDRPTFTTRTVIDKFSKSKRLAFNGLITSTEIYQLSGQVLKDPIQFVISAKNTIKKSVKSELERHSGLKIDIRMEIRFKKNIIVTDDEGNQTDKTIYWSYHSVYGKCM